VVEILQGLARGARSTTPFELLAQAIEELRVRPLLSQRHPGGAERALANVDLFLEMARPYDVRGLNAFATDMRAKWENSEAEIEGRPDAEEQAVHLITMHSAKGLEWPIVIPVNTMTDPRSESGILHNRISDTIHHHLGPVQDSAYTEILENERTQQDHERIRLLYVACTRAAELLVVPSLSAGNQGWLGLLDLGVSDLPAFDLSPYETDLPPAVPDRGNSQDRESFVAEAQRIVEATQTIQWCQPSRHEMRDEKAVMAEAVAEVIVEETAGIPAIQGGPLRGTILHKLMEEVVSGEAADNVDALETRSSELINQLGQTPAEDSASGLNSSELAQTVVNTLALPDIAALRDRLCAEFTIFGHRTDVAERITEIALSGISDAVVLDSDGEIDVVIDWKSDVKPEPATRQKYRRSI
jgi:exodeoxyribonuclease-5